MKKFIKRNMKLLIFFILAGLVYFLLKHALLPLLGKDVSLLTDMGIQPTECRVGSISKVGNGTAPDWSWDGGLITYDERVDGAYEIFLINADGSNKRCLSCINPPEEIKGKHKGKATFHPSSKYLLFSSENEYGKHELANIPGIGDDHDFWVIDLENFTYWRLTTLPKGTALQYPRFSADGKKLLWSQRYEKERWAIFRKGREWGYWKMKLADFSITPNGPRVTNIIDLEPIGKGYYEPHGFLPGDNNKIIMSAQTNPEKSAFYLNIYTYDLLSKKFVKLASTNDIHYEMALYSPDGHKISFMSGPFRGTLRLYKTDLYLMDANGSNRTRLTYFNEPMHPDYAGAAVQIDKEAWSPDGSKIISAYYNHKTKESTLFMITFEGACGKL